MASLTVEIPDDVAKRLSKRAGAEGRPASTIAAEYIIGMLKDEGDDWFQAFIDAGRQSPSEPVTSEQFEQRRDALRRRRAVAE